METQRRLMTKTTPAANLSALQIDQHVGLRVRARRRMANMSQQVLADALGLTFQQVQKYERGSNRISASKLFQIAQFLEVPVSFFFEGLEEVREPSDGSNGMAWNEVVDRLMAEPAGPEMARNFVQIPRGPVKRRLVDLTIALAGAD